MKKQKEETKKEFLFNLSPIYDEKRYGEKTRILHDQINNDHVYNIGILSRFGGGKSSFLLTYEKQFLKSEKYFMTISLSWLQTFDKNNNFNNEDLEKGILQQMLFSKDSGKFPDSQIKRIRKSTSLKTALIAILFSLALLLGIISFFLFFYNNVAGGNLWNFNYSSYIYCATGTIGLAFAILLCIILFRKMSIKYDKIEFSIEKENNNKESLIDKYLDELIYFFQRTKIKYVIFEDIDRFDDHKIFLELRELNTILNSNDKIKKSGKIVFIYAVSEDLFFKDADRTKFFDFILSIEPIITPANSGKYIKDLLIASNLGTEWISDYFIGIISLFFSDMRLLKNTINDCILLLDYNSKTIKYKNEAIVEEIELNNNLQHMNEEAFALMTFRNLFPKFYCDVEKNQGMINKNLSKLVTNIDDVIPNPYFADLKDNNTLDLFLNTMVSEGFIDRHFRLFITSYIDGYAEESDITFIRNINAGKNLVFSYHLSSPSFVANKLDKNKFTNYLNILNIDLVTFFLTASLSKINDGVIKRDSLISLLCRTEEKTKEFISDYLFSQKNEVSKIKPLFINIFKKRNDLIDIILNLKIDNYLKGKIGLILLQNNERSFFLNYHSKDEFFKLLIDTKTIQPSLNENNWIIEFINESKIDDFEEYKYNKSTIEKLLVYKNWVISFDNLFYILKVYDVKNPKNQIEKGLSSIKVSSYLIDFLINQIDKYAKEVLLKCEELNLDLTTQNAIYCSGIDKKIKLQILEKDNSKWQQSTKLIEIADRNFLLKSIIDDKFAGTLDTLITIFLQKIGSTIELEEMKAILLSTNLTKEQKEIFCVSGLLTNVDTEVCQMFVNEKITKINTSILDLIVKSKEIETETKKIIFTLVFDYLKDINIQKELLMNIDSKYEKLFSKDGFIISLEEFNNDRIIVFLRSKNIIIWHGKIKSNWKQLHNIKLIDKYLNS